MEEKCTEVELAICIWEKQKKQLNPVEISAVWNSRWLQPQIVRPKKELE